MNVTHEGIGSSPIDRPKYDCVAVVINQAWQPKTGKPVTLFKNCLKHRRLNANR